jgi:hypothetical protein
MMSISPLLVLMPLAAFGSDATDRGVMLPSKQIVWTDNPRVPGLGLAKNMGDAKKTGPFVHRVKFPKRRVVQAHNLRSADNSFHPVAVFCPNTVYHVG